MKKLETRKETDFEGKKDKIIKTLRNKNKMNQLNNSGKHCQ